MPMNGRQIHSNIVLEWTETTAMANLTKVSREFKKTGMAAAAGISLNKRFNEPGYGVSESICRKHGVLKTWGLVENSAYHFLPKYELSSLKWELQILLV